MNEQTVVLITGALSGIGRATALAFARSKARVVISGRRADEGRALAATLHSLGAQAEFIEADVRDEDDVQALVERTVARFGRLDIAVNAAGTEGESAPVVDQTAARYAAVFDANVLGTLLAMKHELRAMSAQRSGSIVNVSSTMGARGALCRQQTCRRRADEIGGARSRCVRGARQRGRAGPRANADARQAHADIRTQGRVSRHRAAQTRRHARGDRRSDRVRGVGQLHDGRGAARERRPHGVMSQAAQACCPGMPHSL